MFFESVFSFRVKDDLLSKIERVVRNNPEKYYNVSHFVRACIYKELRRIERNVTNKNNKYR